MRIFVVFIFIMVLSSSYSIVAAPLAKVSAKTKARLSTIISTFEVTPKENGIKIELINANGQRKSLLMEKIEQYQEHVRYTFINPFLDENEVHRLELFIFEKLKPTLFDSLDAATSPIDGSDYSVDILLLVDTNTKKTIEAKAAFYYKNILIAEGNAQDNSTIKLNESYPKAKDYEIKELKVTKSLLESYKRSLDVEIKCLQNKRLFTQTMHISLENTKKNEKEENIENETTTTSDY